MDDTAVNSLPDTDTEDVSNADCPIKRYVERTDANFTKSVFNIDLTMASAIKTESALSKDLELQCETMQRDWRKLDMEAKKQLLAAQNTQINLDGSCLSENNRKYLEQAPNLRKFIRESVEFRQDADKHLKGVQELLDIQNVIVEECERQKHQVEAIAIYECLAKRT